MGWHRALQTLRAGGLVVLVDERGAGRADLVADAGSVTDAQINFMATYGRGLVGVALSAARVERLRLPPMAQDWGASDRAFTVSVEAARGISTGISTSERAHTIRTLAAARAQPGDLATPGHIFPLRAAATGLVGQRGRVEAAVALVERAGLGDAAALCEILDDEGELADRLAVERLARAHDLPRVSIDDVARLETPRAQPKELECPSS
jgi:3,4-dihydroxy 2-butanone 4-phosphate synthase/GTP cyclohydrolase II